MEMELYEFIDDLREVNERLNFNMPEPSAIPNLAADRSTCDMKNEEDYQNFELDSTFISYRDDMGALLDQTHDNTFVGCDQEMNDFASTTFHSIRHHSRLQHRSRLFSEAAPSQAELLGSSISVQK